MKMKRVNLGSGTDYLPGWINVDVEPFYHPDVIADLHKPFPFADNTIDELKASDILEHFTKEDGVKFLRECHRVLRVGGIVFIRSHEVFQIFHKFSHDPQVMVHFLYGNTEVTGIFGAHKFAYTKEYLYFILRKIGFSIESYEIEDTNFVVVAKKNKIAKREKIMPAVIGDGELFALLSNTKTVKYSLEISVSTHLVPLLQKALTLFLRSRHEIDVLLLSGQLEKILLSILAQIFEIPVVWIESEETPSYILHNRTLSKVLYRLTRTIPQLVIMKDKAAATAFMMHTRMSLAKIVVLAPSENEKKKRFSKDEQRRFTADKIQGYLQDATLLAQVAKELNS